MASENQKKIAFPHMGTVSYAWRAALRKLGVDAFIPPYTNKRTLSLGAKYAPEAICLPYKLILGNFIEALEGGCDYVSMITSPGICRLGEYGQLIENVLKDLGYKDRYIELSLYDGFKGMYDFLGKANPKATIFAKIASIILKTNTDIKSIKKETTKIFVAKFLSFFILLKNPHKKLSLFLLIR